MDNQYQEIENNAILSGKEISGDDRLTTIDLQNESPENIALLIAQEPKVINLGKLLKISMFSIGGIVISGVSGFFLMNQYEHQHSCAITVNSGFLYDEEINLVSCNPIVLLEDDNYSEAYRIFGKGQQQEPMKPLILLYPEKEQEVQVKLQYSPGFSATFPEYDNSKQGWSVTASPDATLLDHATGQETYGLFWEGNSYNGSFDLSQGFVIKGNEVREFLYEKLTEIGLNTKEKSDFIMFWYPKLQEYPYLQITFAGDDYIKSAPLEISPSPDSLLRVFMVAKPLDHPISIEPQTFTPFERKGFSVVEWGGTILDK